MTCGVVTHMFLTKLIKILINFLNIFHNIPFFIDLINIIIENPFFLLFIFCVIMKVNFNLFKKLVKAFLVHLLLYSFNNSGMYVIGTKIILHEGRTCG